MQHPSQYFKAELQPMTFLVKALQTLLVKYFLQLCLVKIQTQECTKRIVQPRNALSLCQIFLGQEHRQNIIKLSTLGQKNLTVIREILMIPPKIPEIPKRTLIIPSKILVILQKTGIIPRKILSAT